MADDFRAGADKAALLDHLALLDRGGHLSYARPATQPAPKPAPAEHDHGHAADCHCHGQCKRCKAEAGREKLRAMLADARARRGRKL